METWYSLHTYVHERVNRIFMLYVCVKLYYCMYSMNMCVPSDFLARGEIEKDRSVHDVHLAGLCGRHTAHSVFNVLKFNQCLSHAWHHGQVTEKKKKKGSCRFYHYNQLFF